MNESVSETQREVQDELYELAAWLKGIRFRLLGLVATLPESSPCREVIECVIADAILPAIRDLTAAAEQLAESR